MLRFRLSAFRVTFPVRVNDASAAPTYLRALRRSCTSEVAFCFVSGSLRARHYEAGRASASKENVLGATIHRRTAVPGRARVTSMTAVAAFAWFPGGDFERAIAIWP